MAKLGKALEKLNLQQIEARINSILDSADRLLKNPKIEESIMGLKGLLQDARGLVGNVNSKVAPLADNLSSTITDCGCCTQSP